MLLLTLVFNKLYPHVIKTSIDQERKFAINNDGQTSVFIKLGLRQKTESLEHSFAQ